MDLKLKRSIAGYKSAMTKELESSEKSFHQDIKEKYQAKIDDRIKDFSEKFVYHVIRVNKENGEIEIVENVEIEMEGK